jgi:hypothetical protein
MAKQIDKLFERFNELLLAITEKATASRKRYAKELLSELYSEMLIMQRQIDDLIEIEPDKYHDLLIKSIRLLQSIGFTQIDMDRMNKEFIEWLCSRQLKEKLTYEKVFNLHRLYELYKMNYDKEPECIADLAILIKEFNLDGYSIT